MADRFSVMEWTEQRERVFLDRYALKDAEGNTLEAFPEDMWDRVASGLATSRTERREFLRALSGFGFVPAGRILNGVGSSQLATFYNCFVIGVAHDTHGADSRAGIMSTVSEMIEITARGGGVGINWSVLRPRDSYISGVNGYSSGSVSWMGGADRMVDSIRQGGSRTAALMYILDDWHPDVMEFAESSFLRANHSVAVSDEFMHQVKTNGMWSSVFPDTSSPDYNTIWDGDIDKWMLRGGEVRIHKSTPARLIWDHLCQSASQTGNPGLVFLERANRTANTRYMETLISTNPCGEQILPNGGSCNLGAINLPAFWDPKLNQLDWFGMRDAVVTAVKMLNRVIDKSPDINQHIGDVQRQVRRIGLGTMGLADLLILNRMKYGSEESLDYARAVYEYIRDTAYMASVDLASNEGSAPGLQRNEFIQGTFIKRMPQYIHKKILEHGIRNLTLTSQAPTGTTSILAGVSSGIEPVFSREYTRRDATGETQFTHPLFEGEGDHLVTALEIPVEHHIKMQGVVQEFLDNSASKTINLPRGSTWEDVSQAYMLAYDLGCKGITVYVNGCRPGVLENGEYCEVCEV